MLKGISMSRPPLRNVFRLVNSGLEKAALACAAFGLIHATAKADERETVEVALQDQWSNPAAPRAHIDDAWSVQASRSADLDDGWTAPGARRARLGEQVVVTNPVPTRVETLIANATPSTLANDRSDWNDTPRARSPGLIAANTAWRGREKTSADWNNAPVKPVEPIQAKTPDKPVSTDPWLAPQAASTRALESSAQEDLGRSSVDGWTNPHALQTSPSMQGDWSIFAKTSCLDAAKQDASSNDRKSSKPRGQAKSHKRASIMGLRDGITAVRTSHGTVADSTYRHVALHRPSVQVAQTIRIGNPAPSFQASQFDN
jgi:hypothetical protein